MTARIHIERMMHRSSLAVTGDSANAYTLIKLIPSGSAAAGLLRLNLALALDVSGSMYEEDGTNLSRLQRVQDAALAAMQKLRPEDNMAVIGFAHNARVLLPPTAVAEKDKIADVIRRIDTFDIDPGGTAMDEALALALTGVEAPAGTHARIVVLTDGETSGEQNCRLLAQKAAARHVPLTLMGVGLDWKAALLKDLAQLSQGKWYYIDADEAGAATRIFAEEFEALAATAFVDVQLHLRPMKDVGLKRLRQVVPDIQEVPLAETEGRHLVARLGTLQHDQPSKYVLDLGLPARPDGKYAVAQLELTYQLGTGQRQSSDQLPLEVSYTTAGNGPGNAEVMRYIDDLRLQEMSDHLQRALQSGDEKTAVQVAQAMEKTAELMGPRAKKKTMLVRQVLEELNAEGRLARKTQLALQDEVRQSELPG
jgi:Ca-activated chloride channel family protein